MYTETGIYPGAGILREALIKKIRAGSAKKNIYVVAPGGYGKSVTAAQWLSTVRGKTDRMIARETDSDPTVFYTRLARTLARLVAVKKPRLSQPVDSLEQLLEVFGLFPQKRPRCYFVLDDLHMVKNDEIIAALPLITVRLPGYICCLLAGRSEPTPELLATGLFEVFTKDDLLFSREEVEWLGAEKDRDLSSEQIGKLLEITGGWAMYLSAILSGSREPDKRNGGKAPQTLVEYLESRVWRRWDDETKRLLLRLSVPSEITPELCRRLTEDPDGRGVLERLTKRENAFMVHEGDDVYRFHDVFHEFLTEHIDSVLSKDEVWRLNDVAALWFYEQGNYFEGTRHHVINGDIEGINRCLEAATVYSGEASSVSEVSRMNFLMKYVMTLPPSFITESPYLISNYIIAKFYEGDTEAYFRYLDILYAKEEEMFLKHPENIENYLFLTTCDFRVPFKACVKRVCDMMTLMMQSVSVPPKEAQDAKEAKTPTITQNLPYFHRSMRDYSEYYDLPEKDLAMLKATFGTMIGREYAVMEPVIFAGIYYERGELLEAARHALTAYNLCHNDMHPETIFSALAILMAVLYAMGAQQESDSILEGARQYIKEKASFLRPNYMALTYERAIRAGDTEAAHEWLAVYANNSARLPFYQICRHFTTLRAHIAAADLKSAIAFGRRLLTLATEYNRPLDQIETGLLIAIALWQNGENDEAALQLMQTISIAMPYGFTQLIVNEGREILPVLWELGKKTMVSAELQRFTDRLTDNICKKYNLKPVKDQVPKLSGRQSAMLSYLGKGMTHNAIAAAAGLAPGTVKTHMKILYKKLDVHDAMDAVAKAKMLGMLEK